MIGREGNTIMLKAGNTVARFDATSGLWAGFATKVIQGPRLVVDRPPVADPQWTNAVAAGTGTYQSDKPGMANILEFETTIADRRDFYTVDVEISADGKSWNKVFSGGRLVRDGKRFVFPPQTVQAVRINGVTVKTIRLGFEPDRFAAPKLPITVTSGVGRDPATGRPTVWLDAPGAGGLDRARWTMREDGSLTFDYGYRLSGPVLYHGIGFAGALTNVTDVTGLLRGPTAVWKNRMRGPLLGVHTVASSNDKSLPKPHKAGYFADPRWLRLSGGKHALLIRTNGTTPYIQLGSPTPTLPNTTADFPTGDLSFLFAIPAIGNKFHPAVDTGPEGSPNQASGEYSGTVTFSMMP